MKILIIEDNEKHLQSARKFADECGHTVTIAKNYDEAEEALCGEDRFGRHEPVKAFDVVLTDLMMPASKTGLGTTDYIGTEQPYGLNLLMVAMRTGVKAVGLLTDGNHHSHPMTWALDTMRGYVGKPFMIGDVTVLCSSNGPLIYNNIESSDPLYGAKDWMEFYLMVMSARSPMQAL